MNVFVDLGFIVS